MIAQVSRKVNEFVFVSGSKLKMSKAKFVCDCVCSCLLDFVCVGWCNHFYKLHLHFEAW